MKIMLVPTEPPRRCAAWKSWWPPCVGGGVAHGWMQHQVATIGMQHFHGDSDRIKRIPSKRTGQSSPLCQVGAASRRRPLRGATFPSAERSDGPNDPKTPKKTPTNKSWKSISQMSFTPFGGTYSKSRSRCFRRKTP